MAVVSDRQMTYQKRIDEITKQIQVSEHMYWIIFTLCFEVLLFINKKNKFSLQEGGMETDDLHSEVSKLQMLIQEESQKMTKYKVGTHADMSAFKYQWNMSRYNVK